MLRRRPCEEFEKAGGGSLFEPTQEDPWSSTRGDHVDTLDSYCRALPSSRLLLVRHRLCSLSCWSRTNPPRVRFASVK